MKIHSFLYALAASLLCYGSHSWAQDEATEPAPGEATEVASEEEDAEEQEEEKTKGKKKNPMGSYIAKGASVNWGSTSTALMSLQSGISKGLKGASPAEVQKFVSNPRNRLLLAQWMVAFADTQLDEESLAETKSTAQNQLQLAEERLQPEKAALSKLKGEAKKKQLERMKYVLENHKFAETEVNTPWTLKEVYATKSGKKILNAVARNLDWMQAIAFSGECLAPGRAFAILADAAERHPEILKDPLMRDIATATALEFAKYRWNAGKAQERIDYFIENAKKNLLNEVFYTVPFWQMRIICGAKAGDNSNELDSPGNGGAAEVPSMQWSLENIRTTADRFSGSCWRCGYKSYNIFAHSVQGSGYREPFTGMYNRNFHQFTFEVGGVCGGLSHFGAYAAVANGVPALTCGEPGHCSFVVLVGDKWVPAYSLSWERGIHWQPWLKNHRYTCLHMYQELNSPDNAEDNAISDAYRVLGHVQMQRKKAKAALDCYRSAATAQPLNYSAWRDYAQCIATAAPNNVEAWMQMNEDMCRLLVPRYAEVSAEFLRMIVYPAMKEASISGEKALACVNAFWQSAHSMGADKWKIDDLLMSQAQLLGGDSEPNTDALAKVYACMMSHVNTSSVYVSHAVAMGEAVVFHISGKGEDAPKDTPGSPESQALAKELKKINTAFMRTPKGAAGSHPMAGLILAAERTYDTDAFQTLGAEAAADMQAPDMPSHEAFSGELLSEGGVICAKPGAATDNPAEHWGVLTAQGGRVEAADTEETWVAMKLPRDGFISGVAVVMAAGDDAQKQNLQLQISETAEDGSWTNVGAATGMSADRIKRIPTSGEPKAKYIRFLRKGGKGTLQINGIYVYGRRAA